MPLPPNITASGGGSGATLINPSVPGAYTMGDVPIGSEIRVAVADDQPALIVDGSITWGGGTDIVSYLSDPAYTTPAASTQLEKGVAIDSTTYTFYIDATPREYTIRLDLDYLDPATGDSVAAPETTMTMDSIAPSVSFTQMNIGTPRTVVRGGDVQVGLYTGIGVPLIGTPATAGMTITAQTDTCEFGGEFMFLQTIVPQRFGLSNANDSFYAEMMGAGPAIDNGFDGDIGYPITEAQPDPNDPTIDDDNHSWTLGEDDSFTATMVDAPNVIANAASNLLQVGNFATNTPESFDTYVMYSPLCNSIWVALGEVHWAWSGKTTDGMNVTQIPNIPPPKPTVPLEDDAAFPTWTDSATAIISRGWQPYNGKF